MKGLLLTLLPVAVCAQNKPNIIWLMADDLGYGDISCYGATRINTSNIDRVAREGVQFTDMHACASTSTPSRYSILTGEYPFCHPQTDIAAGNAASIIWPQQYTLADAMQSHIDAFRTLSHIAGAKIPDGAAPHSMDMTKTWLGKSKVSRPYAIKMAVNHTLVVRTKKWKYIEPSKRNIPITPWGPNIETGFVTEPQLFKITTDEGETNNVAAKHPALVKKFQNEIKELRKK